MEEMVQYCVGLDVHRDTVMATVRRPATRGKREHETRTFSTNTAGLIALGDWLVAQRVTRAGMESTGVYWKPVFYLLEDRVPEVWLLNAAHMKNVPGRKTDVADSAWIAQLVEHGLVRPSFVPPPPIRELRDFTRYRRTLVEERTRAIQRLEKVLQDAGIKLSSVASTILTKSGRMILEAMLAGQSDPAVLADLSLGRLRSKIPQLRNALTGTFRVSHHGVLVKQMLAHIDFLEQQTQLIDDEIATRVADYEPVLELVQTIPGVGRKVATSLVAEIGIDMSVFPSAAHLASWAGICPGNNASGGKSHSGRARHGPVALRTALTEAAQAAARTKGTYLAAHFHSVRSRRGTFKALGATRHDILTAYWHIVHDGTGYAELGADWLVRRQGPEHQLARLVRQIERLGAEVTITRTAA